MVKIHSDFLSPELFNKLKQTVTGKDLYWYYYPARDVYKNIFTSKFEYMFTHVLYFEDKIQSNLFSTFEPLLHNIEDKYKISKLLRFKLNLYTNQNREYHQAPHNDFLTEEEGIHVGLFNFVTCNGGTIIDGKKYDSNQNELLVFDNKYEHNGIIQTDTPIRIVMNVGWK